MTATPYQRCLSASFVLHAGFILLARGLPKPAFNSPIEIDLTNPILGGGPARLGAPKRLAPTVKGPSLPAETANPPQAQPRPPQEWVLPGPNTQKIESPPQPPATPGGTETGAGTSPLLGGSAEGSDYGSPTGLGSGGASLVRLPQLLNRDEVLANLRRFYPETERRAGNEGQVMVNIHIGADGAVGAVDVVHSAGEAFDSAAKEVARLMRFSPALGRGGPVAVKIRQAMVFQLKD